MTLYEELKSKGHELDHHESDLYVRDTREARAILANHGKRVDGWNVQRFQSNIDAKMWLDIPFAYDPWWNRAEKQVETWAKGVTK